MATVNIRSSSGFSRKSAAPAFSADRAAATSPCAVMKIIGRVICRAFSLCCNSSPSMPAIRMSSSRQPCQSGWQAARKSSAAAKQRVLRPFSPSSRESESRTAASSSTMNIVGSVMIIGFLVYRQGEAKTGTLRGAFFQPQFSLVCRDQGTANCQTQTGASRLAGRKGLENMLLHLHWNPGTGIRNTDADTGRRGRGIDGNFRLADLGRGDGIDSIGHQIVQHGFDLHPVRPDRRQSGRHCDTNINPMALGTFEQRLGTQMQKGSHVKLVAAYRSAAVEVSQPVYYLASTPRFVHRLFHGFFQQCLMVARFGKQQLAGTDIAGDGGQW